MSAGWLELLAAATLKSTLWLALAGMASLLMWRRSASLRHLAWAGAIAGALALPLLQVALPEWPVPLGSGWAGAQRWRFSPARAIRLGAGRSGPAVVWEIRARRVQLLGEQRLLQGASPAVLSPTVAAGNRPAAGLWSPGRSDAGAARARVRAHRPPRAPRLAARARRAGRALAARRGSPRPRAQRLALRRAEESVTPLTWGVVRPVLILPEGCDAWSDERAFEVLVHEAGHVRRHDCLTQLLASAACVFYWFHPLVWLSARRMLTERERACDDFVLLAGARASDYANDLLDVARSLGAPWSTSQVTTAMARRSQISGRLLAVLDPHLDRAAVGRRAVLAARSSAHCSRCCRWRALTLESASAAVPLVAPGRAIAPERAVTPARASAERRARSTCRRPGASCACARTPTRRRWRGATLQALADFYTADAQVAAPLYPIAYGRQGVRGLLQHLVDMGLTAVELEGRELFPVGDLLCETGTARFTNASGGTVAANRFITLWKNEDGRWRIHREWASRY